MDNSNQYYIQSYCSIKNNEVILNGDVLYSNKNKDYLEFIKLAKNHLNSKDPKFYKMDALSKLAFLASDILLRNEDLKDRNISIVFSNKASSLFTDRIYQESIQDKDNYFPSPSVFVYTLPNICIGEISIKYQLFSESSFFIFDKFNANHLYSYTNDLFSSKTSELALCGWVDVDDSNYNAFVYLVSKKGKIEHSIENIKSLFYK